MSVGRAAPRRLKTAVSTCGAWRGKRLRHDGREDPFRPGRRARSPRMSRMSQQPANPCLRNRRGRLPSLKPWHLRAHDLRSQAPSRSEEHTSELQSLMRISYAVFCLKKKKTTNNHQKITNTTNSKAQYKNQPT